MTESATTPREPRSSRAESTVRSTGLGQLVVPAILVAVAIFLIVGTMTMDVPPSDQRPGPMFFPAIVIGLLLTMAAASTVLIVRTRRETAALEMTPLDSGVTAEDIVGLDENGNPVDAHGNPVNEVVAEPPPGREPWPAHAFSDWKAFLTVLGALVAFVVLLRPLGWILAAAVLFWGVAWALGSRRPIFDISVALVLSSVIQLLFGTVLGIGLPAGFLEGVL